MRKTVDITFIKLQINQRLADESSISERQHLAMLLERILFDAKAYKGFRYLTRTEVPVNCEPGIIWDSEANRAISYPDDSRREYL